MPEQDLNPAAAKFISSLVKSLQILCNGQVEFCESIELVGHINVKVDHKYKFDYIVDEQVSKEGEDSATTFLSNSYHSSPPSRQLRKKSSPSDLDQDIMFSEISHNIHGKTRQSKVNHEPLVESHDFCSEDTLVGGEESCPNFSVEVGSPNRQGGQTNQMVVKLEGDDDSNDCMVLPASPGDFEPVGEVSGEGFPSIGPSASFEESHVNQMGRSRKRRQPPEQAMNMDFSRSAAGADDGNDIKGEVEGGGKSSYGKRGASELIGKFAAYECSYCSVILTECEDLSLHSKNCPSPSCSMICLTCGEKFASKPEMRQHLKFVHNHKTFGCKFCDMMFLSSSGLLSHTKAKHKPDSKTLCQICGQAFHNRANLEGHMNMHLGLKPFKCKKCGKSYGHSKSLITHEKSCNKSLLLKASKSVSPSKQLTRIKPELGTSSHIGSSANMGATLHHTEEDDPSEDLRNAGEIEGTNSHQSYSFNNTYQPFGDSKKICNEEPSLQTIHNASQPFPYNNSYRTLQSMDLPGMSNSSSVSDGLGDNVYAQTNTDFVLPQVNYGLFPSGILPDHR